jgi:6,7-dimethyl-8-ribityllumazine synthase
MSRSAAPASAISGAAFKVAIAAARYNPRLVEGLLDRVMAGLRAAGVKEKNLKLVRVPGSNELPVAAQALAGRGRPDVIIALGVIIRGKTIHFQLIAEVVAHALQRVALDSRVPVINGVIAGENRAQAAARCLGPIDRGAEFANAALAMAALARGLGRR